MVEEQSIELFVTETESLVLEAIAQAEAPYSQRAQALLAVDAGSTVEQAAQVASLKVTQVRFWIGRFRNGRLSVFPERLIEEIESYLENAQKANVSGTSKKKRKKKKPKQKPAAAPKDGKKKKIKKAKKKKVEKAKKKKAVAAKPKKTKKEKKREVKPKKKKGAKKSGKKKK